MVAISGNSDGLGAIETYNPETGKALVSILANGTDGAILTLNKQGQKLVQISSDGSRGGSVNSWDRKGKEYFLTRRSTD